jgi:maltooligosyltrehalose synthase
LGTRAVIAVVPRLMNHGLPEGHEIPVGPEVWRDTRLILPEELSGLTYRHVFTGARLKSDDAGSVLAADLFRTCPVALLVTDDVAIP